MSAYVERSSSPDSLRRSALLFTAFHIGRHAIMDMSLADARALLRVAGAHFVARGSLAGLRLGDASLSDLQPYRRDTHRDSSTRLVKSARKLLTEAEAVQKLNA